MTKQSKMLQLLTQIKREFNIGEPRFPHLKLKVSDISPKQDAIELYIRAKDTLAKDNLIAAGIIINCIQTITEVINVGIIISATV